MEAVVLASLVGIGYLFNDQSKKNNPINTPVNTEISTPNGENIYNSEFYNEADQMVKTLANQNFESSYEEGTNIINNQNLNRIGSDINQVPPENTSVEKLKDDFQEYTYSNAAGGYITIDEFKSNDQGVVMEPFFAQAPSNINVDDTRTLDVHQGGNEYNQSKRETSNFFPLEQQQVFGNTFGEGMGDPDRYNPGLLRTKHLKFLILEQAQVCQVLFCQYLVIKML